MGMSVWPTMSRTFSSALQVRGKRQKAEGAFGLTFLVVAGLEPLGAEGFFWKTVVPFLDYQGLSALNDMHIDQVLEVLGSDISDLRGRYPLDPLEVRRPLDQGVEVEVWGYRVELRLRVLCG